MESRFAHHAVRVGAHEPPCLVVAEPRPMPEGPWKGRVRSWSGRELEVQAAESAWVAACSRAAIRRQDFLEPVAACPMCGTPCDQAASRFAVAQILWPVQLVTCTVCSVTYKTERMSGKVTKEVYGSEYSHFAAAAGQGAGLKPRVRRMGRPRGRHLDFGCGGGGFVAAALAAGWDSHGVDPFLPEQGSGAPSTRDRLFRLDPSCPGALDQLGFFDCITMWAVAEHLDRPGQIFRSLAGRLRPGGVLLFNSPNAESLHARLRGSRWLMATLLEHHVFLSPAAVDWMSAHFGLRVEEFRLCGSPFPMGLADGGVVAQGATALRLPVGEGALLADTAVDGQPAETKAPRLGLSVIRRAAASPARWLRRCASSNSVGDAARWLLHHAGVGDHLEVRFTKVD